MENDERGKYYRNIGKIYCPYFKESVNYTDLGFEHIQGKEKVFLSIIPLFKQKSPSEEDDGFSEHLATAECRDGVTPPNA